MKETKAYIDIIGGVEGSCVALSHEDDEGGTRIAGPKPWGGGRIKKRYTTTFDSILDGIPIEIVKDYLSEQPTEEEEG